MGQIHTGITARLAEFASESMYADLSREAVEASKNCLLDWLGVTLAGSKEPLASMLVEVMGNEKPQATVLGRSVKTSVYNAALINGAVSHVLDFDDLYHPAHIHPSATLFPAILSIAERDHLGGEEVISSFATGFEVEARIGELTGAALLAKGWHPTACLGVFGAAAASGKLLHLTPRQMACSLGIAGTCVSGIVAAFRTMGKSFQVGKSSAEGLLAAQLGRAGFTGPKEVLEGEKGFFKVYLDSLPPGEMVADLGGNYRVKGDSFKPYASCGASHAAIDAVLEIRRKHPIRASEVEEIRCQVWPLALQVCNCPEPKIGLEGKFSLPYCVSVALLEGRVGEEQFRDDRIGRGDLVSLERKVQVIPNPAFDDRQAIVTIRKRDGEEYEEKTLCVKGNPENPMSLEDLEDKFRGLASRILPGGKVDGIIEAIRGLEDLKDMNSLIGLCNP